MLLKGIKVLDISTLLPGPMCTLFLADLGAEVIKVESLNGDLMRKFETVNKISPYFSALNRNKKSIALNLKSEEGKRIFIELAKDADVIVESFRPRKMIKLGIGYNHIKKINPKIVYCSITGYGQKAPYSDKAGHDLNYAALSGLLEVATQKPSVLGVQIPDIASALIAAFSITTALFYRTMSGKGSYIDISMLDCALSIIGMHVAYSSISSNKKTILHGSKACYNIYETKDGKFVSLCAIEKKFWQAFCAAVAREDFANKQFNSKIYFIEEMRNLFKSKTLKQWSELNSKYDFCCEPVKKIKEVIKEDYFRSRKMIVDLDGITQVAMPAVFSLFKDLHYSRAPKLGEHTKDLLQCIGYNKKQIARLQSKGVI